MASSLLSKTFKETGEAIVSASPELPSKSFEHFIKMLRQLNQDRPFITDPYERSTGFIIELFAKSVQVNLFVDTPFSNSLEIARQGLLKEMGHLLLTLANALEQNDIHLTHDAISRMVIAYLDSIQNLNREFERAKAIRAL